jgi:hypothetical protein
MNYDPGNPKVFYRGNTFGNSAVSYRIIHSMNPVFINLIGFPILFRSIDFFQSRRRYSHFLLQHFALDQD